MTNSKYKTTEDMINKSQQLKGKSKLNFYQNFSIYYDAKNNRRQRKLFNLKKIPFTKHVEGVSNIFQEVLLLMKLLQTKLQGNNMNINDYDL